MFFTNTHPQKKSIFVGAINVSWLKHIQKPLCKERVSETNSKKISLTLTKNSITNKEKGKEKKEYFSKLNEKEITDNRNFWHTVKPFLSDKVKSKETIILVNNDNVESKETEVAKNFNDFFSNIVKNPEIREYKCEDGLHNRLSGSSVLQAIMKYRNHPSINTIRRFSQHDWSFYFSLVDKNTVLKLYKTTISPSKFFAKQITLQFNEDIYSSKYTESFKLPNVTPAFK